MGYKRITTNQDLKEYFTERLNLPESAIDEIVILTAYNIREHNKALASVPTYSRVLINRKSGRVYIDGGSWFGIAYILRQSHFQCTCCGTWHKKELGQEIISMYSERKQRFVDMNICSSCVAPDQEEKTMAILSDCVDAYDDFHLQFWDDLYPETYFKS